MRHTGPDLERSGHGSSPSDLRPLLAFLSKSCLRSSVGPTSLQCREDRGRGMCEGTLKTALPASAVGDRRRGGEGWFWGVGEAPLLRRWPTREGAVREPGGPGGGMWELPAWGLPRGLHADGRRGPGLFLSGPVPRARGLTRGLHRMASAASGGL